MRPFLATLALFLCALSAPAKAQSICAKRHLDDAVPANVTQGGKWRQLFDREDICVWSRSAYTDRVMEVALVAKIGAAA